MKPRSVLNFFTLCALLLSVLGSAVTVTPVYAASITVNTTDDELNSDGDCSLREAIQAANTDAGVDACAAGSGADIITLATNTYQLTIVTTNEDANANGDLDITDADGLTIIGNNAVIQQTVNDRIFHILSATVTFQDLTITGGNTFFASGILSYYSTVTLNHVEVSGNTSTGRGGGIYNYYGTLTIQNGSVIGKSGAPNIGYGGGGIFTEGLSPNTAVTILDASSVSYNESPNLAGGGFYMLQDARLVIQNGSVVSNNIGGDLGDYPPFTDPAGGGGIYGTASPTITISDSTVSNNTVNCVNNPGCGGGGLKAANSVTITNSTFSNNTVNCNASTECGGGGIYNYATLTVTDSTISDNDTDGNGGGIYNVASLTMTGSSLSDNNAGGSGGGIVNFGGLDIKETIIRGNDAAVQGGGVANNSASTYFENITFDDNTALAGAGLANNGGTPFLTNITFSGNNAVNVGGGMYNYNSYPTLTNVTFSDNIASVSGGGLFIDVIGGSTLFNVIIANSTNGDCVSLLGGSVNASSVNNLIEDTGSNACGLTNGSNGNIVGSAPNLGPLANNGGTTQTHALLSGSPAIDAGAGCPSTDQRGVSRPQGAGCDIGAYEVDVAFPTVVSDSLVASYASGAGPNNFTVTFSENVYDPTGNTGPDDVTNPNNYLIVEDGVNGTFNTTSCASGLTSDDVQVTITSVTYNAGLLTATVNLSGAVPDGNYRLFVCGTTSIVDPALNELNNGLSDYTFDFVVATITTTVASSLPSTGFAPNKITTLPAQPAKSAYSNLGDIWLEIPSQNVKANIVGVPQTEDGWDVTWLGDDAGWLNGTAFPSWIGNSVITGHFYNASGLPGIFVNLSELNYGDQVIVHLFGENYIFEVRETRIALPYSTSYSYKHLEDHSYITLITCAGYNPLNATYLFRRIVRAVLVDVK